MSEILYLDKKPLSIDASDSEDLRGIQQAGVEM